MAVKSPDTEGSTVWQEVAGYLNFSSGASDPKFLRNLNSLFAEIEADPAAAGEEAWRVFRRRLDAHLGQLRGRSATFRDTSQVDAVVAITFDHVLPAYRAHHRDLLAHQSDADLFRSLFLGRVFEAVLLEGPPWDPRERIVSGSLARLNDFLGHRPVAVLETDQRIEPYAHERVRPLPLFIEGAGVAGGRYHDLIQRALELLQGTDRELLDAAWFDPALLSELAVDPRAYDFNHPVNKRPNYHFGQWDPHHIDSQGRYRRFVLVQVTLDALLDWANGANAAGSTGAQAAFSTAELDPHDRLLEAAAVLAGTMLMASGSSGSGPETHDSSTTLSTLLPRIAAYRDVFYTRLLEQLPAPQGDRLRAEADAMRQPFARVRQHLNHALARRRAEQLQNVNLAIVYARLGQTEIAEQTAQAVQAASARMMCAVQCGLTDARRHTSAGRLSEALTALAAVVDLVHRAIECGAMVDPWNIIGFDGNFSLFPAPENSVHDHRVDELLDVMEEVFAQFARVWAAAAATDDANVQERASNEFFETAAWFDRFAVPMVSSVKRVFGIEAHAAAEVVAGALAAWHEAGAAAGDLAFWQPHVEQFDTAKAYGATVEALLERSDYLAAMGVLVHWSGQIDRVRLGEGEDGFPALALRWLRGVISDQHRDEAQRLPLVRKFFELLESNAEEYWQVPQLGLDENGDVTDSELLDELDMDDDFDEFSELEEEDEDDEESDGGLYSAAYENVVYRDSTGDGFEGSMLEGGGSPTNYELEHEAQRLGRRLDFLAAVNQLWTVAAAGGATGSQDAQRAEAAHAWLAAARRQGEGLADLLRSIHRQPLSEPEGNVESLVEYDRRRIIREMLLDRVVNLSVANWDAIRALSAALPENEVREQASGAQDPLPDEAMGLWLAVVRGDAAAVRQMWPDFLAAVRPLSLLYLPLPRSADPQRIVAVRALLHLLRDLLRALPRLGLLRETCQLIAAARQMEQDHPAGPGAVSEFDRLFEAGYKSLVECLVEAVPDDARTASAAQSAGVAAEELLRAMQQLSESLVSQWLAHNRLLRLSVLERVVGEREWTPLVAFIQRYGRDLFTQKFLNLGNLRGILHQGVDAWLEKLQSDPEGTENFRLLVDLGDKLPREEAIQHLTFVLEAIVENYDIYRDYNTTTTQSDRGDVLFTLLDFLRVKARYERAHWNLKPVVMAHEVLLRQGHDAAAKAWCETMIDRSQEAAQSYLDRLAAVERQHGFRLSSVAERIGERLVRPLVIDRMRKLAREAAAESRDGRKPVAFARLEAEASALAAEPGGAGLDLPDWLEALAIEVTRATSAGASTAAADQIASIPRHPLTWSEIQQQLSNWETLSLRGETGK